MHELYKSLHRSKSTITVRTSSRSLSRVYGDRRGKDPRPLPSALSACYLSSPMFSVCYDSWLCYVVFMTGLISDLDTTSYGLKNRRDLTVVPQYSADLRVDSVDNHREEQRARHTVSHIPPMWPQR